MSRIGPLSQAHHKHASLRAKGGLTRQSSETLRLDPPKGFGICMHAGFELIALSVPFHGVTGTADRKRKGPTGGSANGMPRKRRVVVPSIWPRTFPVVVTTRVGAAAAAAVVAAAAAATQSSNLIEAAPFAKCKYRYV